MAEPRECKRCNQIEIIRGRGLCGTCHNYVRRYGNLEEYPKDNIRLKPKYAICIDCGADGRIYGHERCLKCYRRWFYSQPEQKAKHAEYERERRKKDREKVLLKERIRYHTKRKLYAPQKQKVYYQENAERLRQYARDWRKNNRKKMLYYNHQAYKARNLAEGNTTLEQWLAIVEFYCPDGKCPCCGEPFDSKVQNKKLSMDHVVPISQGGTHWPDNLQPLCYSCNCSKSNHHQTDYRPDKGAFCQELRKGTDESKNAASFIPFQV